MSLRARIARCTRESGPVSYNSLQGLAYTATQKTRFPEIFDAMLADGEIVMYGKRRGARYGAPGWKPKRVKR